MRKTTFYSIVRTGTDEAYVGSSINLRGRWKTHRYDLKGQRHHCRALQTAYNTYGPDAFEWRILEERMCADVNERAAIELQWIIKLGTYNSMSEYVTTENLEPYTDGQKILRSAEVHTKMAREPQYVAFLTKRGEALSAYMKTPEARAAMSKHSKRRWQDPEERKRLRAGLDRKDPEVEKRRSENIGKAHSTPEMKEMHRINHAKLRENPDIRAKMDAGGAIRWSNPAAKANQSQKMREYHARRRAANATEVS